MDTVKSEFEPLMTVPELSHYMKIPRLQIYKMTSQKILPHMKIGKRVRFSKAEIDKYLATNSFGEQNE